jgi:sugar lactone lactonase YvrE
MVETVGAWVNKTEEAEEKRIDIDGRFGTNEGSTFAGPDGIRGDSHGLLWILLT